MSAKKREVRTLRIDPLLWTEVKVYCAKNGKSIADFLEELIKKGLKK